MTVSACGSVLVCSLAFCCSFSVQLSLGAYQAVQHTPPAVERSSIRTERYNLHRRQSYGTPPCHLTIMATRPAPPVPSGSDNPSQQPRQHHGGSRTRQPNRIGCYIIERTLGSGSFGKVKLATHSITGHQVALKMINRAKITTQDMGARVKREIQYLKVLRHPHIIKLYEVITTPTDVIMVMEYAGEELFNYIVSKGKMPEHEARRFFQQIICAIEYCHRHKIVHRDLKPENLFLDEYLNVKIGDFGLSNIMTDGDFLKTSCGSPNYAAPEVISGKLYSGPEIDIWSCGVILYVMLCGRLPFDDDHIPSLFKKIESGQFHLSSSLSTDARRLLQRMLVVDPVKRITVTEIRALSWFQQNLPHYLQPLPPTPSIERVPALPVDDLSTLLLISENEADPEKVAQAKGLVWSEDLGILDPSTVNELCEKITSYSETDVWEALQKPGDNQIKVAYQLVRDHKRVLKDSANTYYEEDEKAMESFLASSPPAWNAGMEGQTNRSTSIRRKNPTAAPDEPEWEEEEEGDMQDIPNSNFNVLNTSLFGHEDDPVGNSPDAESTYLDSHAAARRAAEALIGRPPDRPSKQKWHFGIRSRSPPMEVMLEIYKTLGVLGMQWKRKTGILMPDIGPEPEEGWPDEVAAAREQWEHEYPELAGQPKKPLGKKEAAAQEKAAQGLFFVETRSRHGDIVVRMDLQLYQVDAHNYLVDFRNVGYYRAAGPDTYARAPRSRELKEEGSGSNDDMDGGGTIGGVCGPFLFLEMACRLISELAQ